MPKVVSDIVDIYVFRRLNAQVQFLLLQRRKDVALPGTWQAFHVQVLAGESTLATVKRTVRNLVGLEVAEIYSADYVNQFYDENRDAMVLAPVFAVTVAKQSPVELANEYADAAWLGRNDALSRLAFSGQRWAVRHIDEIMNLGDSETAIYRIDASIRQPVQAANEDKEQSLVHKSSASELEFADDPVTLDVDETLETNPRIMPVKDE